MNNQNYENKNCEYNNFKKARYFHGMLMTERDFQDEQKYHIEKRKLVNRMLHGFGVVCGLQIKPTPSASSTIIISRGLALDCYGNEIFVNKEYSLNLENILTPEPVPAAKKAICKEETASGDKDKLYIIIRYNERDTDQVPIYAPGGDCKEKACENSRNREGFCIDYTYDRPNCCDPVAPIDYCNSEPADKRKFICEDLLIPCESCCDPVVLGSISVNGNDISQTGITDAMINNWDCRKYVMSFGLLQHFRKKFPNSEVSLDTIFDYASFGAVCDIKNPTMADVKFNKICGKD
jgi:hypothetical protein